MPQPALLRGNATPMLTGLEARSPQSQYGSCGEEKDLCQESNANVWVIHHIA
jgi:hypothetical protein